MNTYQIDHILSNNYMTQKYYDGIYSRDTLTNIKNTPKLIVCNTDPSFKAGQHWILFYFHNETVDYFDSLGHKPDYYGSEFVAFMKRFAEKYNICYTRVQPFNTSLCGHYCIWFAYLRCQNYSMYEIINSLPEPSAIVHFVKNQLMKFKNLCKGQKCITY